MTDELRPDKFVDYAKVPLGEYLAKYVVEEIARWEGPIKAAGLQVD